MTLDTEVFTEKYVHLITIVQQLRDTHVSMFAVYRLAISIGKLGEMLREYAAQPQVRRGPELNGCRKPKLMSVPI